MVSFFKRRSVLVAIGLILIAVFIWLAGPYFAFAGYLPLVSPLSRLLLIAAVVSTWAALRVLKMVRARRASNTLVAAVVGQADAGAKGSAEAQELREKFEDAIDTLKQRKTRGAVLYEMPWYVIIGPPGAGKTTALEESGLHFAVGQRSDSVKVQGVGGTRNCHWWFADEAVLIDTAGRYTTQDSDAASDHAAWSEFLALLRTHRSRRPLNGVILAVSVRDLLSSADVREKQIAASRRRLEELYRELRIQLPVYVMVTKGDVLPGFTEYFDDLAKDERAQVWGVTFPYDRTLSGEAPATFGDEFDSLIGRLNERLSMRLEDERDVRRRVRIFGFPQHVASLRGPLDAFVAGVFGATRFDRRIFLRGVYLTSGTQDGTVVERLIGSVAEQFDISPDAVRLPGGRGKAYFIERLIKEVIIAESGLAGLNRRVEIRKAAAQVALYAAIAGVAVLAVAALGWSFNRNRNYLHQVAVAAEPLRRLPALPPASLDRLLPRLTAIRQVTESAAQYQTHVPLGMRWGLYQGNAISNAARDAYVRELDRVLLPWLAARLERRLTDYSSQPEKLYEYLKAYLMLGQPSRLDPAHVAAVADAEWSTDYAAMPDIARELSMHLRSLLDNRAAIPDRQLDASLLAGARSTIRQASVPQLVYSRLKLNYADDPRVVRLDVAIGVGAAQSFRRKSGKPLSSPIPALYSAPVFREVVARGISEIARQFADEEWVWGERGQPLTASGTLSRDVLNIYEDDYIAVWDGILNDLDLPSAANTAAVADLLGRLGGRTSPLRGLLQAIDANTFLAAPAAVPAPDKPAEGVIGSATRATGNVVRRLLGGEQKGAAPDAPPGSRVTAHFVSIHQLISGQPGNAPIDRVIDLLGRLGQQLGTVGADVVGGTAPVANPGAANDVLRQLKSEAGALPPALGAIVTQAHDRSASALRSGIRSDLENRYQQEVVSACREVADGNYPFVAASPTEAPPGDMARIFGPQGVFETFFKSNLEALVDSSRTPWRWKSDVSGNAVGGSPAILRQFEAARRIRDSLFAGGAGPGVQFTITPAYLDDSAFRFSLEIDGQSFEYRHGPPLPKRVAWPGPNPGFASVSFEDRTGARVNREFKGNWALFRLIDSGQLKQETVTRHQLTFQNGGHEARLLIEAQSVRNPFAFRELQQFRCQM